MALDSKSGSRKINQNVDLAPGARDLTTTGNITAGAFYGDGSNLTGVTTASANDALITITAGGGLTGGGGFTVDQAVDAIITVSHSDTSAQASVANTAFNVIQSITLDTYGHITAIGSKDIGTAGFYVKTTGETGTGVKIGLGSLTYQTVQFFAGTGLSVVRTDNEIQFSAPNAANWDTAYGWGNHANTYLPLIGGTLSGDLIINKANASILLYDPNTQTTNSPQIRFNTANNQGVKLVHNEFDSELPVAGYGLVLTADNDNTQFPTTGTLSFVVHGEIYAGGTTNLTTKRVWHQGDFTTTNVSNWDTAYSWGDHADTYLPLTGGTITGGLTSSGIGQFAGAIRITETGTAQNILIGNQDSGGVNNPSIIQGVNGALRFGNGNSWEGEGGTFTEKARIDGNGFTLAGSIYMTGTTLQFANNDGFVYDDANNIMNVRYDGVNYPIISSANIASQSVNYASTAGDATTIDGFDSTDLYRRVYADYYAASPTSRWYVITLPYAGTSGWSDYFYFDVLAHRDIANLQSQLHYRVYLHNRGISANNNQLNASVVTELEQPLEFAEFGYKSGVASSSQFFIKLGEDYSGISIVAYPGENTITASMIASQDTAPTGFTAVTPTKYAKDTINLDDVTSNGSTTNNSITALSFLTPGGTSGQFLKANGSLDSNSYALASHTHSATDITSGTLADARLSGVYSGITLQTNGGNTHYTTPNSGSPSTNDRTVFGLAQYKNDNAAAVGAIVFYAPNTNSTIMHRLRIEGMLYSTGPTVMCIVQGYRTTGAWSQTSKVNLGITDVQVRFAVDATGKNCVILGDVGTTWSYPMMAITHAMFSHSGVTDAYCKDWTVGLVTDLSTFTQLTGFIGNTAINNSIIGNAGTATKLLLPKNFTIGDTAKAFDGSAAVSWTLAEIGALGATAKAADSNLLDGIDSASFFRSDADDTASGTYTFTGKLKVTQTATTIGGATVANASILVGSTTTGIGIDDNEIHSTGVLYIGTNTGNLVLRPAGSVVDASGNRFLTTADEGTGNGLDADTLDGNHASAFLQNSGTVTHSGLISFTGTGSTSGIRFNSETVANDAFGIRVNGTSNAGELEFYSTDDDTEPFVFRHYTVGQDGTGTSVEWARINNDFMSHQSDMRAPIFYDLNNTAYYLDPSSVDRSIFVNGYITTSIGDGKGFEIGNGGAHLTAAALGQAVFQGTSEIRFGPSNWDYNQWGGIKYTGGTSPVLYIGGPASSVFSSNATPPNTEINFTGTTLVYSDSSFRAPIFYDSDNTAYYVDPSSSSQSAYFRGRITQISQANSSWPYLFTTSAVGDDNSSGFWVSSVGYPDMRLRREDGTVRALISSWERSYTSFGFTDSTDMRAPIFYDSNNTSYYVDPNSNSQLVRLGLNTTSWDTTNLVLDVNGAVSLREGMYMGVSTNNFNSWSGRVYVSGSTQLWSGQAWDFNGIGWGGGTYWSLDASGNSIASGSHRAPIFYDSNNTTYFLDPSTTGTGLNMLGGIVATAKTHRFGESTNWDAVGFGNLTNVHFQGHNYFWIGAGNGTWFAGTANTKNQSTGLAADASYAHDLLITTMPSTSTYDRGITFAVDSTGAGTSGWRLGKWHSGDAKDSSKFVVDGQIFAKAGYTDEFDYYADDYSTYYSSQGGLANWSGDTNAGWHVPAVVASSAIQIQSGNTGTNSRKPQIQFHQYGYGGPAIEYDGPNKKLQIGAIGTSTQNRLDTFSLRLGGTNECFIVNTDYAYHNSDMRAPLFYDSNDTNYYIDPSGVSNFYNLRVGRVLMDWDGTDSWFRMQSGNRMRVTTTGGNDFIIPNTGEITFNGKYLRNSYYRTVSGYSDQSSGGNAGWYRVAEITLTGNCTGGVLYGTLYDYRYDGADAYHISIVARAECDFTTNNESHYVNIGCSILGSTNYSNYQNKIRVVLVASSTNLRTYEVQFYETPWNRDVWELQQNGGPEWTIYSTPQATRTAVGSSRAYYTSNQNADYQRANTASYSPIFYDSNNTGYYVDPASTSSLNAVNIAGSITIGGGATIQESTDRADLIQITSNTSGWGGLQIRNSSNEGRWSFMTDGESAGIYNDEDNYWHIYFTELGATEIKHGDGATKLATSSGGVSVTGTMTASGDVVAYSDASVKENIQTIDNALEKVISMRGVSYNRTDINDKSTKIGVIAQEIQKVLPEVVQEQEDGLLGVSYGNITAVLIEAIKEQQKQIEELKAIVDGLTK